MTRSSGGTQQSGVTLLYHACYVDENVSSYLCSFSNVVFRVAKVIILSSAGDILQFAALYESTTLFDNSGYDAYVALRL